MENELKAAEEALKAAKATKDDDAIAKAQNRVDGLKNAAELAPKPKAKAKEPEPARQPVRRSDL